MSFDTAFDDADLNGFVDGRIEPARAAELAESLASDPDARARIDGWKRQNESLRTMFASVLFEPLPVRLLPGTVAVYPSAGKIPEEAAPPRRPGRLAGVLVTTSIGMALVGFAIGALTGLSTDNFGLSRHIARGGPDQQSGWIATDRSLGDRAADAHRTFIGDPSRPVELTAAEEPKLLHWIQHRVGASLRIPDLARQGWSLIGGRIVPGPREPAAFLVYGSGADRLGLTMSRSSLPKAVRITTPDVSDPVAAAAWGDDTYGYVLTSDRGTDWLERSAGALRESIKVQIGGIDASP